MEWIIAVAIKVVVIFTWALMTVLYITLLERKESAVIQDRIGANRAAVLGLRLNGFFQPFADALKMFFKEDYTPPFVDKPFYFLAPIIALFFALVPVGAIPVADSITLFGRDFPLSVIGSNVGVVLILSLLSLAIYGVIFGGYGSRNKYGLIGGMRATAQIISYEVALGLSIVGVLMVFPSLNLNEIVHMQNRYILGGWVPLWGIILQPLAAILFLIAGMAENKRVPFDLPEGESEIIGYFLEYSGMKFGMFFVGDFVEVLLLAALFTTFFLGGYNFPWLFADGFHFPWGTDLALSPVAVRIVQFITFNIKLWFMIWFLLLVRWTYPRYRYDQLMDLGWKSLIPLSILNILITAAVMVVIK